MGFSGKSTKWVAISSLGVLKPFFRTVSVVIHYALDNHKMIEFGAERDRESGLVFGSRKWKLGSSASTGTVATLPSSLPCPFET